MHFFNLYVLSRMRRRGLQQPLLAEEVDYPRRRRQDYLGGLRTVAVPVEEDGPHGRDQRG
jgi:hypothetical protein